jgi:hypothetical protein
MSHLRIALAAALLSSACSSSGSPPTQPEPDAGMESPVGVRAIMSFEASAGFFDAPFPIEHRRDDDGRLRLDDFPNPQKQDTLTQVLSLAASSPTGFSLNGGIFLRFDGAIDADKLPSAEGSLEPGSPLFLVDVTPGSPRRGARVPIVSSFKAMAETYSPEDLLGVVPYPGFPLSPDTTYALVVRRSLGGADQRPLSPADAWSRLAAGEAPEGAHGPRAVSDFAPLFSFLQDEHIDPSEIAAATVWTTGDPRVSELRWRAHVATLPAPVATELSLDDDYDDYCVIKGKIDLPIFQKGPKPYDVVGSGYIVEDAAGNPVVQEQDHLGFVITVPKKAPMPAGGFPIVLFGTGSGGKARQVIDRAPAADPPNPPGLGPALYFANRGIAVLGFPAPLAWDRNPAGTSGKSATFNVGNMTAFRGNVQQGALDFTSLVALVREMKLDPTLCPSATTPSGSFSYDKDRVYMWGHSTGSTMGGLAIPTEPGISAGMLSGAGGTWLQELTIAESPVPYRTLVKLLLGYDADDEVDVFDPPLTLLQTVMDPVDVTTWAPHIARSPLPGSVPKPLLLIEGVIDTYHFPRMVDAQGVAAGLDVVGPLVDPGAQDSYALAGRGVISAPVHVDAALGPVTGVTVQREQREGIDGHHVPFEWGDVKYRYSCFFEGLAKTGQAVLLPPVDDGLAPCAAAP